MGLRKGILIYSISIIWKVGVAVIAVGVVSAIMLILEDK